jgi:hypothetical protein
VTCYDPTSLEALFAHLRELRDCQRSFEEHARRHEWDRVTAIRLRIVMLTEMLADWYTLHERAGGDGVGKGCG